MLQIYCTSELQSGKATKHKLSFSRLCFLCLCGENSSSVIVAAVAVDLATDFAAWPSRAVNVYVSSSGSNRLDEFIEFAGANTPLIRQVSNIRRHDGARDRRRWCRTRLSPCGTIAEVSTKEHADGTSHALLSKVDMRLLNSAFKIGVTKLPINSRFIVADTRIERPITVVETADGVSSYPVRISLIFLKP